jgi:manganese oxidase
MSHKDDRRTFIRKGTAAAAGMLTIGGSSALAQTVDGPATQNDAATTPEAAVPAERNPPEEFTEFSRYHPSFGGPPESDHFLGKLVPGLRGSGLEPVPVEAPDLDKIPWRMVDGRKEYHIYCENVRREVLPGNWMNFFGYNGTMPGPTIEAVQGDRVRFVVHNHLPEMTTIHWHGLELPIEEDGVPGITQDAIMPGDTYVYEYDLHQAGTFFYHSHMPMQEASGMVGFFIIHPKVAWDPPVDRDFLLLFQNFMIRPNTTVPDSFFDEFNWHTINGRSGPYTTPMVVKHGERVRIRILDFSPQQHHPIHLHGHTFWVTGHEGTRIPRSAWIPRNTELIAVAQASDFEFIAFNPGDWIMHCHMVHHMMNHMVIHVGPRIREGVDVASYKASLDRRPRVKFPHTDAGFAVPGYPQMMQSQGFTEEELVRINSRRETRGMRHNWHIGSKGLMTIVRVLPEDLYDRVMNSDEPIEPGAIFNEIARRRGDKGKGEQEGDRHLRERMKMES